jgi:uncharacterized protein (DUF1330 family)
MCLTNIEVLGLILVSVLVSFFVSKVDFSKHSRKRDREEGEQEVYMIINLRPLDPVKQKAYQDTAIPLAEKAGMKYLAAAEPVVLGGEWPYEGLVVIEKFRSLKAVQEYWHSEEYQKAREMLVGADMRDFTIIVEAG